MLTGNSDNRGHDVLTRTYNYTRIYSCIYFVSFKQYLIWTIRNGWKKYYLHVEVWYEIHILSAMLQKILILKKD